MALVNLRTATRADVLEYFENTWDLTDTLCVRRGGERPAHPRPHVRTRTPTSPRDTPLRKNTHTPSRSFSSLKNDSVFYSIPDKLRRPLIFYFGHPAALYINKLHQAGLVGAALRQARACSQSAGPAP